MFCEQFVNDGILYLYDELQQKEKQVFEKHAATCKACQAELEVLRNSRQLFKILPEEQIEPVSFAEILSSSGTGENLREKYILPVLNSVCSIIRVRPGLAFVPAVAIVMALLLIYILKTPIPIDPQITMWDSGLQDSLNIIDEKIEQFKTENVFTESDSLDIYYSSTETFSDEKIQQIEADIELLSSELNSLTF